MPNVKDLIKVRQALEKDAEAQDDDSQSFREYCQTLFEKSQVSGFNQIASARNVLQRCLKTFVFIACMIGFLYQTISFLHLYWKWPTFTEMEVAVEKALPFPAITIV